MFAAARPCWWLLLLLSLHPTFRFLGRWCSQLASLVGGCCFYFLFILPSLSRQAVLAAAHPCWWLLLLLSPHPTSPLQAGGFAAGCPCWWLLLLLSFHPTSPLQVGGVCSCSPMLVAAASTLSSSHLPFLGRWRLQLPAPVGGCCFYSLFIPPPLSGQVVFTASCPCWWLLLLLSPHPTIRFLDRWCSQLASLVGGCCFYSLFIPPPLSRQVVLAAACPCWWLLLLLSLHPTSLS